MKAKFLGLLAGVFAIFVQCAVANAVSITQTQSFDLTTPTVTFQVTNNNRTVTTIPATLPVPPGTDSDPLTFTKFDTTLGNLTVVTITFTTTEYSATVTVLANNQGTDPATFFSDATMDRSLTGAVITSATSQQMFNANCSTDPDPISGSPVPNCNDSTLNNLAFGGTAVAGALSLFNGPGTFDLTAALSSTLAPRVTPDNGTGFADNATFSGTLNANWKGDVSVKYDYDLTTTPVPEPLSLYLLAAGLGGIALSRRRRR